MPVILFTKRNSNYLVFGFECYNEKKNAMLYTGDDVVIAHPPCRLWAGLRGLSTAPIGEKELGTFAVNIVRNNGGIVEHPASSLLFKDGTFTRPGIIDLHGGFLLKVDMSWFGFHAKKSTMLYIVGCGPMDIPAYPLSFDAVTHVIGYSKHSNPRKKELSKSMRDVTPVKMCEWLLSVARVIENKKEHKP